jgi:membrane-associated PAP2 superfamily phosphatase
MLSLSITLLIPGGDLAVSHLFWRPGQGFIGNELAAVRWVYDIVPWLGRLAALVGLVLLIRAGEAVGVRWRRRGLMLSLVMVAGVGALVNGVFKEHWGRARPVTVDSFGGNRSFTPVWMPSDECRSNCSFVSGHAATGFALMGVGALATLRARRRWCLIGIGAGLLIGLGRIAQGGHFLSDVIFAGLAVWASVALFRALWLRSRLRRRRRHARRQQDALPPMTKGSALAG